jgi:hypothetical protein
VRGGWWYRLGRFPLPAVIFYMWCAMIDWARASAKSIFCSNVAMRLKVPDVLVHVADPDAAAGVGGRETDGGVVWWGYFNFAIAIFSLLRYGSRDPAEGRRDVHRDRVVDVPLGAVVVEAPADAGRGLLVHLEGSFEL